MDIKEPQFDEPSGFGTTSATPGGDRETTEITQGTRVTLTYRGKGLIAEVTAVETPAAAFVARVLGFDDHEPEHDDLSPGDSFRFRREDVRWVD